MVKGATGDLENINRSQSYEREKTLGFLPSVGSMCHCEERSDAAISSLKIRKLRDCFASRLRRDGSQSNMLDNQHHKE